MPEAKCDYLHLIFNDVRIFTNLAIRDIENKIRSQQKSPCVNEADKAKRLKDIKTKESFINILEKATTWEDLKQLSTEDEGLFIEILNSLSHIDETYIANWHNISLINENLSIEDYKSKVSDLSKKRWFTNTELICFLRYCGLNFEGYKPTKDAVILVFTNQEQEKFFLHSNASINVKSNLLLYMAINSPNPFRKISNTIDCLLKLGVDINDTDANNYNASFYANKMLEEANRRNDDERIIDKYESIEKLLMTCAADMKENKFKLLHCKIEDVEALVFSGGGPKGTAYIGVLNKLKHLMQKAENKDENNDVADFKKIRRVAGTSAGAIVAGLLAVGYTPEELEIELKNLPMLDFIDNNLVQIFIRNNSNFERFRDCIFGFCQSIIKGNVFSGDLVKTIKSLFQRPHGLNTGDKFLDWIENKIREKIKTVTGKNIKYLTFGELRDYVGTYPTKLKDLYVVATNLSGNQPEIREFNSEDGKSDSNVISYAIRASMSIPGLFSIAQEYVKNNVRVVPVPVPDTCYIDGGLIRNYPINIFDTSKFTNPGLTAEKQNYMIYNDKVVGFVLENPTNEEVNPQSKKLGTQDYVKEILNVYYDAERMLMASIANNNRTIRIDCGGITTSDFNLQNEQKQKLIDAGARAVDDFFPVDPR